MKRALLSLTLFLTGCYTTYTAEYNIRMSAEASTAVTVSRSGVVCDDPQVLTVSQYKLPDLPTFAHLRDDDTQGIVDTLIDHIGRLRQDLKSLSKDYRCKPPQ